MTKYIKCGGGGLPPQVITDMNAVLNKKFSTSTTYPSTEWADMIEEMTALPEESASGSIAHFTDGADTVPLKSCTLTLAPTQSGTGDPSPTNPRPITGVSSVNVTNNGANFWNEEWEAGSLTASGGDYASTTRIRSVGYTEVPQNATFYAFTNGYTADIHFYDENETHISYVQKTNTTFTTPPNTKYIRFCMSVAYGTTYNNDISINYPSTDTTYHAFVNSFTTYPISWTDTVYGGYVNEKGEVWATHGVVTFDGNAEETWVSYGSQNGFTKSIPTMKSGSAMQDGKSNFLATIATYTGFGIRFGGNNNSTIYLCHITDNISGVTDVASWKTYLQSNNLQVCYPLATPVKIATIDPIVINSALGVNNVWHDGNGDVEVEYRADIELYINQ